MQPLLHDRRLLFLGNIEVKSLVVYGLQMRWRRVRLSGQPFSRGVWLRGASRLMRWAKMRPSPLEGKSERRDYPVRLFETQNIGAYSPIWASAMTQSTSVLPGGRTSKAQACLIGAIIPVAITRRETACTGPSNSGDSRSARA